MIAVIATCFLLISFLLQFVLKLLLWNPKFDTVTPGIQLNAEEECANINVFLTSNVNHGVTDKKQNINVSANGRKL